MCPPSKDFGPIISIINVSSDNSNEEVGLVRLIHQIPQSVKPLLVGIQIEIILSLYW